MVCKQGGFALLLGGCHDAGGPSPRDEQALLLGCWQHPHTLAAAVLGARSLIAARAVSQDLVPCSVLLKRSGLAPQLCTEPHRHKGELGLGSQPSLLSRTNPTPPHASARGTSQTKIPKLFLTPLGSNAPLLIR